MPRWLRWTASDRRRSMASGCVLRREGVRGVVWYVKFTDSAGKQVKRRLGPEPRGNEKRAQQELGKLLAQVEKGWRKPDRLLFEAFAERFLTEHLPARNLKRSSVES